MWSDARRKHPHVRISDDAVLVDNDTYAATLPSILMDFSQTNSAV